MPLSLLFLQPASLRMFRYEEHGGLIQLKKQFSVFMAGKGVDAEVDVCYEKLG